jgi:hypothetical protein
MRSLLCYCEFPKRIFVGSLVDERLLVGVSDYRSQNSTVKSRVGLARFFFGFFYVSSARLQCAAFAFYVSLPHVALQFPTSTCITDHKITCM